jgi:diguanylate cyclase (GGDEF)-like protein
LGDARAAARADGPSKNDMCDGHHPLERGLGRQAAGLEVVLVLATLTLVAAFGPPEAVERGDWLAFGLLLPLTAIAHLLGADRTKHQGSQLSLAPIFTAVLVLPPSMATLLIALAMVPEALRTRTDLYVLIFNICNVVAPALLARLVFDAVDGTGSAGWAAGAALALLAFLLLHYGLLAGILHLARGVRPRDTIRLDCVLIDAGLLSLGAIAAALWSDYPALAVLTLLPLALAYRSLAIPALVEATRVEPKTGLYNPRHFAAALGQELGRAQRFDRPIAVLVIDVDQLCEINTAHGYMAGDRALVAVAEALRSATREYDVAARFGGDEFCVLLPETDLDGALVVAERVRTLVEELTQKANAPVTVSIGAVSLRGAGLTAQELMSLADRAAHQAKASGRNAIAAAPALGPVEEAERVLADAAER